LGDIAIHQSFQTALLFDHSTRTLPAPAQPRGLYAHALRWLGPAVRWYSRVEVRGAQHLPSGGAMLASNHPGSLWWDAFCIAAALPQRQVNFVAQDWDRKIPVMAQFLDHVGAYFQAPSLADVDRADPIVGALRNDSLLCAFPEQAYHTLRTRNTLYRFSPHAVKYARLAAAPVIPCAVLGAEKAAATLAGWKLRGMPFHVPWAPPVVLPLKIVIELGEPQTFGQLVEATGEKADSEGIEQLAADELQQQVATLIRKHRPCDVSEEFYLDKSRWI